MLKFIEGGAGKVKDTSKPIQQPIQKKKQHQAVKVKILPEPTPKPSPVPLKSPTNEILPCELSKPQPTHTQATETESTSSQQPFLYGWQAYLPTSSQILEQAEYLNFLPLMQDKFPAQLSPAVPTLKEKIAAIAGEFPTFWSEADGEEFLAQEVAPSMTTINKQPTQVQLTQTQQASKKRRKR